jgi:hypothetical protein
MRWWLYVDLASFLLLSAIINVESSSYTKVYMFLNPSQLLEEKLLQNG